MDNVFVYCETEGTQVAEVSQELLTKGRKLADELGVELHAVVAGTGIKGKVEDQILPYGVEREDEFAPVKNATGNDSPESACKMLGTLHRYWLEQAKVNVKPGTLYEISPRLTYGGENLSQEVFDRELGRGIFEFDA